MCSVPDPETLLNLTHDKIVVIDERGIYRHLNATVTDQLGFTPAQLRGTDAFDLVHPDDAEWVRDTFEAIVAGDRDPEPSLEYRYRTADDGWVWLRTRVYPPTETGLDGYVLSSRDVTREVETRRRLETIAAASSDVFWMFTADWDELLFINDAVEQIFGLSKAALEHNPYSYLAKVHPADRPFVERAMDRLSAGESIQIDYRIGCADDPTTWVRVPAEPVYEDGTVVAVAGFARDVTDEYRRERQLTVMDNLLRHTIRNDMNIVDGTAERIADQVRQSDQIPTSASTGTPTDAELGASAASATAVSSAVSDESVAPNDAIGDELLVAVETIRRVADDLVTTAEKQRGVIELLRQRGSPQPTDIRPIVEQAVADVIEGEEGSGRNDNGGGKDNDGGGKDNDGAGSEIASSITVSCPDDARAFTHTELDYALGELIENGIEHAQTTPAIHIDVTPTADSVDIAIYDNCPQIPPEERDAITDRWAMDDIHHTAGMGLWLAYWITDRSGGDLTFETHDDGNVVILSVPNAKCSTVGGGDATTETTPPETAATERSSTETAATERSVTETTTLSSHRDNSPPAGTNQ